MGLTLLPLKVFLNDFAIKCSPMWEKSSLKSTKSCLKIAVMKEIERNKTINILQNIRGLV